MSPDKKVIEIAFTYSIFILVFTGLIVSVKIILAWSIFWGFFVAFLNLFVGFVNYMDLKDSKGNTD